MKTKQYNYTWLHKALTLTLLLLYVLNNIPALAQYHQGSGGSSIATSQSNIIRMNNDVRSYDSHPMSVVVWDGATPKLFMDWSNGTTTYHGSISLPSYTVAPDVSILYDNTLVSEPYIVVVYMEENSGAPFTYNKVHYQVWYYDLGTNSLVNYISEQTINCNSLGFATIDADSRGFFAMAWESDGDLHTIAGKLKNPGIMGFGAEKVLNLPVINGCNDVLWPDVALYGKNTLSTSNYIYYSYLRCGNVQICWQTQNFYDIYVGAGVPAVYSNDRYVPSGAGAFTYPRIAANQYFNTGAGNGALLNEFTVVASLYDVDGSSNDMSSIFCMTSTNDGANNITYSYYDLNTNYYTGSGVSDFYATQSGTPYTTVESKMGFGYNDYPVVSYDKDNDHIAIAWAMYYNDVTYATAFPIGYFPAHVYANPAYDGSNDPSMQTPILGICPYNGLDNSPLNSASTGTMLMAASSHNSNDLFYAWFAGNGQIYTKTVTSGNQPRTAETSSHFEQSMCYPNPYSTSSGSLRLNISPDGVYTLSCNNMIGDQVLYSSGTKTELESILSNVLQHCKEGLYQLRITDARDNSNNGKIVVIK